jgi:hypothetical protein
MVRESSFARPANPHSIAEDSESGLTSLCQRSRVLAPFMSFLGSSRTSIPTSKIRDPQNGRAYPICERARLSSRTSLSCRPDFPANKGAETLPQRPTLQKLIRNLWKQRNESAQGFFARCHHVVNPRFRKPGRFLSRLPQLSSELPTCCQSTAFDNSPVQAEVSH